ncbi:class I SAM-dependent RNA methyltransferase [Desulfovibrio sp. JC022]|uniref:THUMP domain-containing class I SAM-dependent RNA methyltransferase n=1 Tax=Desulfovibrio sp. JC022 TaxID=2593642 RepID=UPI0013D802DC|nr:class I SAM-dependent RNA methyltransferase [Desulfovibrio sp. JC022]NDV23473.1 class I SAM-dependent RNA methyltransferase [Desulfovibrio sp. JC022]
MMDFERKSVVLVTCPKGFSPYLAEEMGRLGFKIRAELYAGVETKASLNDCMRLNLWVRCGHRVMYQLKKFKADTPDEMYNQVKDMVWENILGPDDYLTVTSSVRTETVNDSRFANVKVKDAIVDRIREKCGRRPSSGPEMSGIVVFLHWKDDECTVYLDTSGVPLSRRGYRKFPHKAPLQETLAATLIRAAQWYGRGNFVSPMCGSGTLAIEAALVALNGAPGLMREYYSFMKLPGYNPEYWDNLCIDAEDRERDSFEGKIIATDLDPEAVEAAKKNARAAGVEHHIEFDVCDFRDTQVPDGSGVVMMNPEYGERLGSRTKLEKIYSAIGDFLKNKCQGYKGLVFTGNLELAKFIGLKASKRLIFYNAKIECRLLEYEIFKGSRKSRY